MPTALITGISGFVGPYLVEQLRAQNIECVGIAREVSIGQHPLSLAGIRIHEIDVQDRTGVREVVETERPDLVFHMAAISHIPTSRVNPQLVFDVNVTGTLNLLESLRQAGRPTRVVVVSTGNVYGDIDSGDEGFAEGDPVRPSSPYATSKAISEQIARCYFEDFGLEVIIVRPFNHTGAGQRPSFACSEFARGIAAGVVSGARTVHLKTGRLEPRRDICDVRDVVRAYALLAERGKPGQVYNVGSGSMASMSEVIETLAELARVRVTTETDPLRLRPREIMRSGANCRKIHGELGWLPKISFRTMLGDLLDYWIERSPDSNEPD